jgi:hypothetical protein
MSRVRLVWAAVALSTLMLASPTRAHADEPAAQPATGQPAAAPLPAGAAAQIDLEKDTQSAALVDVPEAPPEAPPPPPYKPTVVVDSSLGALVFLGKFGKTAPPAPWIRTQVGYELFKWLMAFGEGELGFTDTSRSQDPPKTRSFPLFAFGGGARLTARFTDRFGVYLQGSVGAMQADITRRALEIIGYKNAESLGLYFGGRLGLEWYQLDRHFALGLQGGLRDATGFKLTQGKSDTPLAFDAGVALRYAF